MSKIVATGFLIRIKVMQQNEMMVRNDIEVDCFLQSA